MKNLTQRRNSVNTRSSERYQTLFAFSEVYGIGPVTARKLYDTGLRSIEDLERYYDVPVNSDSSYLDDLKPIFGGLGVKKNLPDMDVKVALALRKDFDVKISRAEVEDMQTIVMKELEAIRPGCISMVVGG